MMNRRTLLRGIGLGGVAGAAGGLTACAAPGPSLESANCPEPIEVVTTNGRIRGLHSNGVSSFRGIPYGDGVSEDRRFMRPRPPGAWDDILDATAYGPLAPQENPAEKARLFTAGGFKDAIPVHRHPVDEDCLTLNIWTPSAERDARRPVMVWYHGGSFVGGSGNTNWYDGTNLSRHGDIVVITVNHRIGTTGFLHLGHLFGDDLDHSGLNGMLDLVLGLEWVRDNISAFGGDPDNVTIFGESGGGMKVSALLAMPTAKGLFHKAIIQSGAGVRMQEREHAERVTDLMIGTMLGLNRPSLKELQDLPIDHVIAAQQQLVKRVRGGELPGIRLEYQPVVDGRLLPQHPFDPSGPTVSADVPVMVGYNETDASWGMWLEPGILDITESQLLERARGFWGAPADEAVALYRRFFPDARPFEIWVRMRSYPGRSITLAERKGDQGGAPVFVYNFAWNTPAYGGHWGSPHMLEIPFVFRNLEYASGFIGGSDEAEPLSQLMADTWVRFARTGRPAADGLPDWPAYDRERRAVMRFDVRTRLDQDPERALREFWQAI